MEYFRDAFTELKEGPQDSSLEESLAAELARDALPLFASLSSSGHGAPGPHVPAASNADMMAHFLGTEASSDAPINTSVDGQLDALASAIREADDSSSGMIQAATKSRIHLERSMPSLVGQAALLHDAKLGMQAATELLLWTAESQSSTKRFASPRVERQEVSVGEKVTITVTADEIAALVGARPEDVLGATILITMGTAGGSRTLHPGRRCPPVILHSKRRLPAHPHRG